MFTGTLYGLQAWCTFFGGQSNHFGGGARKMMMSNITKLEEISKENYGSHEKHYAAICFFAEYADSARRTLFA
jgi:hypothetical protein